MNNIVTAASNQNKTEDYVAPEIIWYVGICYDVWKSFFLRFRSAAVKHANIFTMVISPQ